MLIFSMVSLTVTKSNSEEQIYYTFIDEVIIDTIYPNVEYYNIRNPNNFTEIYNASYSFTNDVDYEPPNNWISDQSGGSIRVFDNLDGHSKVLELNDTSNTDIVMAYNVFSAQTSGTIEFFFQTPDYDDNWIISFGDGITAGDRGMQLYTDGSTYVKYYDGSAHNIKVLSSDQWWHFKIEFDVTTDTFNLFINGRLAVEDGGFRNALTEVTHLVFETNPSVINYKIYLDAIGFSWWDNYTIGENIVPVFNTDVTIFEKNKDDLNLLNVNYLYSLGAVKPSGWSNTEIGSGEIIEGPTVDNRYYQFIDDGSTFTGADLIGFEKDFSSTSEKVNVTMDFEIEEFLHAGAGWYFNGTSSDDSEIFGCRFLYYAVGEYSFDIYDGNSWQQIITEIPFEYMSSLNGYIDYYNDLITYYYYGAKYTVSLWATGKNGLGNLVAYTTANEEGDLTTVVNVDNMGVYDAGSSVSEDFAFLSYETNYTLEYILQHQNIFTMNTNGIIEAQIIGSPGFDFIYHTLYSKQVFNNSNIVKNFYYGTTYVVDDPKIQFYLTGNFNNYFNISYLRIAGI